MEVAKFAHDGMDAVLIGHAGHPEVEGTMGRFSRRHGGQIHLVEDEADVADLIVQNGERLAFVTQTTLSMDDTARVIDALREKFPASKVRVKTTSVMPLKTAKMRSKT